jgi:hypothetical protein
MCVSDRCKSLGIERRFWDLRILHGEPPGSNGSQGVRETFCLHLYGMALRLYRKDGRSRFLRNIGACLPHMTWHARLRNLRWIIRLYPILFNSYGKDHTYLRKINHKIGNVYHVRYWWNNVTNKAHKFMVYKYIYYSSSPTCFGPLLAFFRDALLILENVSQDFYIILITVN